VLPAGLQWCLCKGHAFACEQRALGGVAGVRGKSTAKLLLRMCGTHLALQVLKRTQP